MELHRIMNAIGSTPWAIEREALEGILEIAQRQNESPQAVAERLGKPLEYTRRATVRGSVATVPVQGPLFRRANLITEMSGATSYEMLAQDFATARDNTDISAILLEIDTPGGDVNGLSEVGQMIYAARAIKPVIAYVGGQASSAGYWIASAASEVVLVDTALVGCIGAVLTVTDSSERDRRDGLKRYEIVSSQTPNKRIDIESDEGRAHIQARADEFADLFIDRVAEYRGIDRETVLSKFGRGGTIMGQNAVDIQMADRVGTYEGEIARLNDEQPTTAPKHIETEYTSMDEQTLRANHGDLVAKIEEDAKASVDLESAKAEAAKTAAAEATTAERERITGIQDLESAVKRPKLAQKLAQTEGMTVEMADSILQSASEESTINSRMANTNPDVDTSETGDDDEREKDDDEKAAEQSASLGKEYGIE